MQCCGSMQKLAASQSGGLVCLPAGNSSPPLSWRIPRSLSAGDRPGAGPDPPLLQPAAAAPQLVSLAAACLACDCSERQQHHCWSAWGPRGHCRILTPRRLCRFTVGRADKTSEHSEFLIDEVFQVPGKRLIPNLCCEAGLTRLADACVQCARLFPCFAGQLAAAKAAAALSLLSSSHSASLACDPHPPSLGRRGHGSGGHRQAWRDRSQLPAADGARHCRHHLQARGAQLLHGAGGCKRGVVVMWPE